MVRLSLVRMRASLALLTVALLTLVPLSSAQDHEHAVADGPRILLQADLPEDGRALVGHPAHFQFALLDQNSAPIVHQNVELEVVLNGLTLFQTASAHDYDGTGGLDIVFPATGEFTVTVRSPGPELEATYSGYAVRMKAPVAASLDHIEIPSTATAGIPTSFRYANVDADGTLLAHTDVQVEIRRIADDFPVLSVHTHSHEDAQAFNYTFEKAGAHSVRFVGYQAFPSKSGIEIVPYSETVMVDVAAGTAPPARPSPSTSVVVDALPIATAQEAQPEELAPYATVFAGDPISGTSFRVGPFSQVRHTLLVRDVETDTLVQHVNHEAVLRGPNGLVFESASLHEYDGALEIMTASQTIGTYNMVVTSSRGDWIQEDTMYYDVMPADLAQGAGPQHLYANHLGALKQGEAGAVELFAGTAQAVPFMHSEVSLQILDGTLGIPLVATKLHTHTSGLFGFSFAHAASGAHTMQADLFDIHGSPTPLYFGQNTGSPTRYAYEVLAGTEIPSVPVDEAELVGEPIVETSPGAPLALLLMVLAALVGSARVRRRAP